METYLNIEASRFGLFDRCVIGARSDGIVPERDNEKVRKTPKLISISSVPGSSQCIKASDFKTKKPRLLRPQYYY